MLRLDLTREDGHMLLIHTNSGLNNGCIYLYFSPTSNTGLLANGNCCL